MSTPTSERLNAIRTAAALALLIGAGGCKVKLPDKPAEAEAKAHNQAIARAEGKIVCAPTAAAEFAAVCALDRVESQDGLFLTLRHPDGGFRRLLVTRDGRGVISADGAEPAVVTPLAANLIEVALGEARYRLPATVRGAKAAR
jgi:hypothetical protein